MLRSCVMIPLIAVLASCAAAPTDSKEISHATLMSRSKYNDYEKATFSFEHGVRDDPDHRITRNDWDLEFGNGGDFFRVTMVTDDRSRLELLGKLEWKDVDVNKLPHLDPYPAPEEERKIPAMAGHMYMVRTRDRNSDLIALFRVEKLIEGDSVDISWMLVDQFPVAR